MKLKHFLLGVACLLLFSCTKDDTKPEELVIEATTVSGKWTIANSIDIQSIELNENFSYLITSLDSDEELSYDYGSYTISADKKVELKDFGVLSNLVLSDTNFDFILRRIGETETAYNSNKAEQMISLSPVVEDLCRTWNLVMFDDMPVAGTEFELHVLFSEFGTYFIGYLGDNEEDLNSFWKWRDSEEQILCYSHNGVPTCEDGNMIEIIELTSEKLVISEDDSIFELEPVN